MVAVVISDNSIGSDYPGTEDNALREGSPTQNRGTNAVINVNKIASGNHWHTLLSFSGLSNFSPGTVTSAIISLYLSSASGSTSQAITIRRIIVTWGELTSNYNTTDGSTGWGTPGCLGDGSDRIGTASDTITGVTNTTGTYYASNDSAQIQADVEDFADGTLSNYGWHFERTDAANDGETRDFVSSDGADGNRPKLAITYTTGGEEIPNGTLTLTGVAPSRIINKIEPVPNSNIFLTGFAPTTLVTSGQTESIPNGTLTLSGFAPTTSQTDNKSDQVPNSNLLLTSYAPDLVVAKDVSESIPNGNLYLTSYAPNVVAFVPSKPSAGARGAVFQKRVIVNGKRYTVNSYTELRRLLTEAFEEKTEELQEIQAKTPSKKRIKVLKTQIRKIEKQIAEVDQNWTEIENEEILLLLAG